MFARSNVETGRILTRFSGNKWRTVDRGEFNLTGESTSYDSSYSGGPMRVRGSVPLLPAKEREEIVGQSPSPPAGLFDVSGRGHPYSWHEKKTNSLAEDVP